MQAFLLLCFQGLWLFSEYPATRGRRLECELASAAEFVFTKRVPLYLLYQLLFPYFLHTYALPSS